MLLVLVGVDGSPKQVKVEQSSGYHELDRAAVQAAKRWKFNPGTRNGVPYEGWAQDPGPVQTRGLLSPVPFPFPQPISRLNFQR